MGDLCDNCISTSNADQSDSDGDAVGDACDLCPGTVSGAIVDAGGCPPPIPADFDRDGDVDGDDFGFYQRCFSGTNVPADVGCARLLSYAAGCHVIAPLGRRDYWGCLPIPGQYQM